MATHPARSGTGLTGVVIRCMIYYIQPVSGCKIKNGNYDIEGDEKINRLTIVQTWFYMATVRSSYRLFGTHAEDAPHVPGRLINERYNHDAAVGDW